VKVDREGFLDPAAVRAAVTDKTILIAVQHANHDIGTIEPVREIGQIAAEKGIAFYVDAEASAGWLPIDVQQFGANLLSLSAHRFYGPKGAGILYRNKRARLVSILHGACRKGAGGRESRMCPRLWEREWRPRSRRANCRSARRMWLACSSGFGRV